jgi:Protein of unknown function (DUF4242)
MTYWWDQVRSTGFCLVQAPDAAAAERVHREAHGEIANTIIPVDLATVEPSSAGLAIRVRPRAPQRRPWIRGYAL